VTVPRRNFVRGAGHADRRRYAPAYKGDGSMLYPQGNSARNNPDDIPSAKATKGSALKTAQRLSQQPPAFEDRAVALMMSVVGIAGFMLAVVSPTIASAATIEEVAHCRAIPQLAERLNCFKSLKPGPRPKTEDVAPGKKQQAGSSKVKNAERPKARQAAPAKAEQPAPAKTEQAAPVKMEQAAPAKMEQVAPVKMEQAAPAKTEQAAPVKMEQEAPAKTEQAAPAKAEQAAPAKAEQAASAKAEQPAPSNTQTTTQSNAGEALISPTPDDPATTVSIDHLSFAPGQPICVDQYALAGTILAGLLTSDPTTAATRGCQTIPDDAKLERLERFPSVFSFMRTIRVKVTSPTQPDLTSGFTIEMGR
jgi:hypothetical protein